MTQQGSQGGSGYSPPKRIYWLLALIPIIIAVLALLRDVTDFTISGFPAPGKAATDTCADRLPDDSSAVVETGRLSAPHIDHLNYEQSQTNPGHIVIHIGWAGTDRRNTEGLIQMSGRRGPDNADDFQIPMNYKPPQPGQCGTWYRNYHSQKQGQLYWLQTFDGLWGDETYCFAVNASDGDGGSKAPYPSFYSKPVCIEAKWKSGWGKVEKPTT